ncbi:FKBP-type peptidyl-prolyl cis-trans isomerase, partial [Acinetobacter baumannii]
MEYTLTNDGGDIIDSSVGGEPLAYLHGHQNIIPGLEKALLGKVVGDSLKVSIPAAEGYGEVNPALVEVVPKHLF